MGESCENGGLDAEDDKGGDGRAMSLREEARVEAGKVRLG